MRNSQLKILSAAGDASRTSSAVYVGQICSASFIAQFADVAATGSVKIQASNEAPGGNINPNVYVPSAASWADVPNATSTVTAGVAPAIVIGSMCFAYIRVVFTRSAGGVGLVVVNMNQIGV